MSSVIISFPSVRREPGFRPGLRLGEGTMHVIHLIFQGFLLSVRFWTLEVSVVVWPSPLLHRGRGEPSDNPHYSSPGCKDLTRLPCYFLPVSVQLLPLKWYRGAALFSQGGDANVEWEL